MNKEKINELLDQLNSKLTVLCSAIENEIEFSQSFTQFINEDILMDLEELRNIVR